MNRIIRLASACVREALFPAGCGICQGALIHPEEAWYGLCSACAASLKLEDAPRCCICGRPLISEFTRCFACRSGRSPGYDRSYAIYPYIGRYRKLLAAYKFNAYRAVGNFLAENLIAGCAQLGLPVWDIPWVPVPPRPGKIKAIGWDQVAELGRVLQKRHGVSVVSCLKRLPSRSQKELDRESRRINLRGRILCQGPAPRRALLFDDVITTGSTLDACAQSLKAAGTQEVYALSLFYD